MSDEAVPYEALAAPAVAPESGDNPSPFLDAVRNLGKTLGATVVEEKKEASKPATPAPAKPAETKQPESKVEPQKSAKVSVDIPEIKDAPAPETVNPPVIV